jgi:Fuc2NAc and GlcNAc transferase
MIIGFLCAVMVVSLLLTCGLRQYALKRNLIDTPNCRSSHTTPTPRGGGVAIVISFLVASVILSCTGFIPSRIFLSVFGSGLLVALIGFLDDHGHIAARWRLVGHFSAAAWALYWLGSVPPLPLFGTVIDFGWAGYLLGALYLVWMLNLYNFMDGIDGIASIEAVTVCLGACILYWFGNDTILLWLPLMLAMAVLGFLYWNLPKARIFMGDAGSGFLGVILAIISLQAGWIAPHYFWGWLILLGVFIVDATYTLIRRLLRGEKVYQAHRSHAYQYASRMYGNHLPVTVMVGAVNIVWLLPISICVVLSYFDGITGVAIAYVPLIVLAVKYRAGEAEVVDSSK